MRNSTSFPLALLGLGLLGGAAPAAGQVLTNNGGTLFVNTGGTLQVNGNYRQTAGALLRTTGTARVAGTVQAAAGSTLDLSTGELQATGNVSNAGSAAGTTGTLRLTGPGAQTLTLANTTVPNLTVAKASGSVVLAQPVQVQRTLTLATAANLDLNGQVLTLLSDATGTALVVNAGAGVVTGNTATMQRYLTTSNAGLGYRHYSSPMRGNALADLGTGTFTPVFNAAYNSSPTVLPAAGFPTVMGFDQGRIATATSPYAGFDKGWFSPLATDAMGTGTGYSVHLNGTEKVDFTGTPGTGDYVRTLARAAGTNGQGLHLVGNPYPAPIDWSLVVTSDRQGIDAALYVFESSSPYGGSYRSAVNGVGSSSFIGSSQGFFVRVTPGQPSGTLTFRNTHRLTSYAQQVAVRRGGADQRPQLRLTLAGTGAASDDFHLYAQTGATPGTDAEFDAVKMTNPTGLNLASRTATGEALAIDGRADFGANVPVQIPLQVNVPAAGRYTLTAATVANLPAGTRAELVDNLTNARTALVPGTAYAFGMTTTTAPGRFWLNLTPAGAPLAATAAARAAQVLTYPNPTTGRLTVLRPAGAAAPAVLLNALGQTVRTLQLPTAETALDLRGLATGVYTLRLTLDGQPVNKRVVLE